jgi:hypothetical protein
MCPSVSLMLEDQGYMLDNHGPIVEEQGYAPIVEAHVKWSYYEKALFDIGGAISLLILVLPVLTSRSKINHVAISIYKVSPPAGANKSKVSPPVGTIKSKLSPHAGTCKSKEFKSELFVCFYRIEIWINA